MEYTTHYAIAKHGPYGEGEALSAYSIINPAMDTIDDILFEHQGLIDALEERMDNAEDRLDALENRMDNAEDRLDQHHVTLENHEERITNLENRMDTAETNITRIDQNIDEIETNIDNIETNIDNIEGDISTINNNITNIEENIDNIEGDVTNLTTRVTNIENLEATDVSAIWAAINAIVSKVTGGGSVDTDTGSITWNQSGNIAVGNMSLFGNEGMTSYIRARTGTGTNDVRAQ